MPIDKKDLPAFVRRCYEASKEANRDNRQAEIERLKFYAAAISNGVMRSSPAAQLPAGLGFNPEVQTRGSTRSRATSASIRQVRNATQ